MIEVAERVGIAEAVGEVKRVDLVISSRTAIAAFASTMICASSQLKIHEKVYRMA